MHVISPEAFILYLYVLKYLLLLFNYLQMAFTLWKWYHNKIQHTNTHVTQNNTTRLNKTQHTSYKNNKGHIIHNEYNAKIKN
jgi:Na+(H+)/acetate symporter ActP